MSRYKNVVVDGKMRQEHRLVWEAAYGPIPDGMEIHHIDGNGHNNDLKNLKLLTRSEHALLHAKLRKEGRDVVDTTDPEIIQHRNFTKRYCEANKERRRIKNAEYRASHKEQEAARKKRYYEEHRDERLDYSRRYREANIDRLKEYNAEHHKKYYAEHHDEIRERRKKRYATNSADVLARNAAYYEAHKSEIDEYRRRYREINRPWMYAKDKLKRAKLRGDPPERIAEIEAEVEAARIQVEKAKKNG